MTSTEDLPREFDRHFSDLPGPLRALLRRVVGVSSELCQRCDMGHVAAWDGREWVHGCDRTPGGVDINPEPCGASALWIALRVKP